MDFKVNVFTGEIQNELKIKDELKEYICPVIDRGITTPWVFFKHLLFSLMCIKKWIDSLRKQFGIQKFSKSYCKFRVSSVSVTKQFQFQALIYITFREGPLPKCQLCIKLNVVNYGFN